MRERESLKCFDLKLMSYTQSERERERKVLRFSQYLLQCHLKVETIT